MTPEQIAQIATQAAIAAVQAMGAATAAPVTPSAAVDLPDDAKEEEEAKAVILANQKEAARIEEMANEIVPHLMQPRHLEVFEWAAKSSGVSLGGLLRQVVRSYVAKETPNWRVANGGGGASSRNLEELSERLPVHK